MDRAAASPPPPALNEWPNPKYAWYVIIVLTTAHTLGYIDRQVIALLIGPLKADLVLTDFQISLLGGPAFALFYTLMGIPLGRLVDRKNRRFMISCGIFFWSIATISCGVAKSFWALFLARVGVGVGEATLSPAAFSMIADYFPPEKLTRPLSFYLTGVWVGIGMAFILGGAVIDIVTSMDPITVPFLGELKSWQIVFMTVGAPGLLFPLILLTVREPVRRNKMLRAGSSSTGQVSLKDAMSFVWTKRSTYGPLFAGLGLHAAFGLGASFWTIEFFIREFGIGRSNISYIYGSLSLVFGIMGSLSGGWIADLLERRGIKGAKILTGLLGMSIMLPFAVMFPLMPSVNLAAIGVAGVIFCTPFPYGPSVAAIQLVTPNEMRGFVSGIYVFVAVIIGLGVGPPLIAGLTDYVFRSPELLPLSIVAAAVLLVPAAILCMHVARKQYTKSLIAAQEWTDSPA